MIERLVRVGDTVAAGQAVARIEPSDQQNAMKSARARLSSAEAALTQARLTYGRQQELLKSGWTARARYDEAEQAFLSAQAQVDSARADLRLAEDRLGYTVLLADGSVRWFGPDTPEDGLRSWITRNGGEIPVDK
jgi:multidrug efflux pump subunit AcrA (membrane-fusion protein)